MRGIRVKIRIGGRILLVPEYFVNNRFKRVGVPNGNTASVEVRNEVGTVAETSVVKIGYVSL